MKTTIERTFEMQSTEVFYFLNDEIEHTNMLIPYELNNKQKIEYAKSKFNGNFDVEILKIKTYDEIYTQTYYMNISDFILWSSIK